MVELLFNKMNGALKEMELLEKVKTSGASVGTEFREKLSGYLSGALGLVAGLAWNDAVKSLIAMLFPADQGGGVAAKFVYAIVITVVVVFFIVYFVRLIEVKKEP